MIHVSERASIDTEIEFANSILTHSQSLINLADAKAGILLAADGGILAILGAYRLNLSAQLVVVCSIVTVALVGLSAFLGGMVIKPRRISGAPATKVYFGSILQSTREEYVRSFSSSDAEILQDLLNNIYTLALIQKRKYLYLHRSFYSLMAGLVPLVVLVVILRAG